MGSRFGTGGRDEELQIYNRTDCCTDRLSGFTVFISSTPFGDRSYEDLLNDSNIERAISYDLGGLNITKFDP